MNTPAHLVVSLALLGRGGGRRHGAVIAAGALVPDLPMFFFYAWQKLVLGTPELVVWRDAYFQDTWQRFFDAFNSLPLALAGLALGLLLRRPALAFFCGSLSLHALTDLPLHHDDAHRHFLPFSEWRFESPVSYWDPRHHGAFGAGLEVLAVGATSAVLWRRSANRWGRALLLGLAALGLAAWLAIYAFGVRLTC